MKKYQEFLLEKIEGRGTLNVFDIDETLYNTFAKIKVTKDGDVVRELNNQEFNEYKLKPGEKYDFGQFRDAAHFRDTSKPIDNMFAKAKRIISRQNGESKTILLTARADFDDPKVFLQTFRDHGFPIDNVHVERAGNLAKYKHDVSAAVTKMVVLRKYINSGRFNRIRVWDDSVKNLSAILKLTKLHPEIKVETFLVDHHGGVSRYP